MNCPFFVVLDLKLGFDLRDAILADQPLAKDGEVIGGTAEGAGGDCLAQNDAISFGGDLDLILGVDAKLLAKLRGDYNSAQLVDFSDDSGIFHALRVLRNFGCFIQKR